MQIELTPGGPTTIQQAVDEAQLGGVIRLAPGVYRQGVRIANKQHITIESIEKGGALIDGPDGIDLDTVLDIGIIGVHVAGALDSGISMQWKPNAAGRYRQDQVHIIDCHVYQCGGAYGLIGHNLSLRNCTAAALSQVGDDCDFTRVWGEDILVSGCTYDGTDSEITSAHADGFQCWSKDATKYLRRLTVEDCSFLGGPNQRIHQGFMFESYTGLVSDINIDRCRFENIQNNAIIMRGIEATVRDCTFLGCTPGKAENADGKITSINNVLSIGTPAKFNEVNGGTVVYQDVPAPQPTPTPEPTPEPNPDTQFPFELNQNEPQARVIVDSRKPLEQVIDPATLLIDVTDPDYPDEATVTVNGQYNITLFGTSISGQFDNQRTVLNYDIPLGYLHVDKPQELIFEWQRTQGCTIHGVSIEYTPTHQPDPDRDAQHEAMEQRWRDELGAVKDRLRSLEDWRDEIESRLADGAEGLAPAMDEVE